MDRTSTLSGLTMATPISGRPPPRGKPLRVTPYGLHPPRLAAHLWTYTTSRDINQASPLPLGQLSVHWSSGVDSIHRPSPYEGAALPLSYRTAVVGPLGPSRTDIPCGLRFLRPVRLPIAPRGGVIAGASPGARTLTRRLKRPVLCRSSSRRVTAHALGGDQPESNRHQRIHIPRLCH